MPFTFAHPAAILPIRRHGNTAALIIGSLIPDVGYLLMLDVPRDWSHGPSGIFLFCLPLGIMAYVLYVAVLREPWLMLLPPGIRVRVRPEYPLPRTLRHWAVVLASLVVGVLTHVGWDALTQLHWILQYRVPIRELPGGDRIRAGITWYVLLRHGSAVIGIAALTVWIVISIRRTPPRRALEFEDGSRRLARVMLSIVVIGLLVALSVASAQFEESSLYATRSFWGRAARFGVGILTLGLIVYAVGWQLRRISKR